MSNEHKPQIIMFVYFSADAANVAIKLMSSKLDRLSLRFSRAIQLDFYHSKCCTFLKRAFKWCVGCFLKHKKNSPDIEDCILTYVSVQLHLWLELLAVPT